MRGLGWTRRAGDGHERVGGPIGNAGGLMDWRTRVRHAYVVVSAAFGSKSPPAERASDASAASGTLSSAEPAGQATMRSTLARHGQASQGEPNPELFRGLASRGSGSDESVAPPGLYAAGGGGAERHDDRVKLRLCETAVKFSLPYSAHPRPTPPLPVPVPRHHAACGGTAFPPKWNTFSSTKRAKVAAPPKVLDQRQVTQTAAGRLLGLNPSGAALAWLMTLFTPLGRMRR